MKIAENSQYWQRKSSYVLSDLRNFNEILMKHVASQKARVLLSL